VTSDLNNLNNHCLQLSDVQMSSDSCVITFRSFKHSVQGREYKIGIYKRVVSECCPVIKLQNYLKVRGEQHGCLFVHPNNTPISRSQFIAILNAALSFIGLSPSIYKGHSFRIGSATLALQEGKSDAQIRALGRWRSNAFLKYLRPELQMS